MFAVADLQCGHEYGEQHLTGHTLPLDTLCTSNKGAIRAGYLDFNAESRQKADECWVLAVVCGSQNLFPLCYARRANRIINER